MPFSMLFSTSRPLRDALNLRIARALAGLVVLVLAPTAVAYDWLQFNFDVQRSGNNTLERTIHRNNVGQLVLKWQVNLGGNPDGSPVLLDNVSTAAGITAVVYVSTRQGTLIAVDTRNGTVLWSKSYPANGCTHGGSACDMATTPAIDPNRQYIYNYGLDGYVHKYQVGDGTEVVTGGWPQQTTLKGFNEKHGGGLAIATSGGQTYLYVVHGGYPGDAGDYQGHITTINLATGTQKVFNAACSNLTVHIPPQPGTPLCNSVQTAVWARPGVVYDPRVDRVFFATGNANGRARPPRAPRPGGGRGSTGGSAPRAPGRRRRSARPEVCRTGYIAVKECTCRLSGAGRRRPRPVPHRRRRLQVGPRPCVDSLVRGRGGVATAVAVPAGLLRRHAEEDGGEADDDVRQPHVRGVVREAEEPRRRREQRAGRDVDQVVDGHRSELDEPSS